MREELRRGRKTGTNEERERENIRGIADLSISMAATTLLPPDLIKNTAVLRLGRRERVKRGDAREKGRRVKCAKVARIIEAISILLYHFLPFSLRPRRGDYHPRGCILEYRVSRGSKTATALWWDFHRNAGWLFGCNASARVSVISHDCEFIWWCNRRRAITLAEPRRDFLEY